jgi:hypothetical protein
MKDELKRILKEVVVAYLMYYPGVCLEAPVMVADVPGEIRTLFCFVLQMQCVNVICMNFTVQNV